MTVLAQLAMKDAAKCDMHCDLQISVNKLAFERIVQLCLKWGLAHAAYMIP